MLLKDNIRVAYLRALSPARRFFEGKILRGTAQVLAEGLSILVQEEIADGPALSVRMASALHLLAVFDPQRCARVRSDLRQVCVVGATGPALWRATYTCILPAKLVREASLEWLASMVVHEATHARLGWRRGRGTDTTLAVETCCVRAQMAFLRRLPVTECPKRDELLAYLSQVTSNPWWKGPELMRRRREALAELGAPEWLQYFFTGGVIAKTPPKT